jgi:kynureninase
MSRDDIIRMAREAWDRDTDPWLTYEQAFLTRFAALVAAAEREACAKLAASKASVGDASNYPTYIAAAIRARGRS